MITLDGSTLEGGGQLVRVALSISAICNIPIRITNIRAGRGPQASYRRSGKGPSSRGGHESKRASGGSRVSKKSSAGGGLKESHLAALNWLAEECNAKVEGAEVGSLEVVFKPRPRIGGREPIAKSPSDAPEVIELRNPGSVWLIWQAVFPYVVFAVLNESKTRVPEQPAFRIRLRGGTNVPKSPSSEYMQQVFFPLCEKIGLPRVNVEVVKRGWTTGAPEIGEVEISVFHPNSVQEETTASEGTNQDQKGDTRQKRAVRNDGRKRATTENTGFRLQPFTLKPLEPFTITSISITTLTGSLQTHSLLHTRLRDSLRLIPKFSSPTLPIHTHASSTPSSGDDRRLYILLTAHLPNGYNLGRDYLGPGRKITDESERRSMVDEAVNTVVREFKREVERERCVDEFAEDQLVVFQALAVGASRVDSDRVGGNGRGKEEAKTEMGSLHTRTVRWVCGEMLGTVFDGIGGCEGSGLVRQKGDVEEIMGRVGDLDVNDEEDG